jgi:tetratricopeptide (TPR) repeat protein
MTKRRVDARFLRHGAIACLAVCHAISACATGIDVQATPLPQDTRKAATTIQAPGLRGLIDPGGYSAPAVAAAAAGLISAMADIRRTKNAAITLGVRELSCSRLSELAKHAKAGDLESVLMASEALILDQRFGTAQALLASVPAVRRNSDFHDRLALADEGTGQFAQAAESYRSAAERSGSEDDFFGEGYELVLSGNTAEAEKAFRDGLLRNAQSVMLRLGVGATQFLQGHTAEAIRSFLEAARLAPSDSRVDAFLGASSAFAADQAPQVKAALKSHLDLSPSDAMAHDLYATVLLQDEPVDAAQVEALLKQALALDAHLVDAHFQLGTLYAQQDNTDRAIAEYEAVLRLDPGMKEAHYRLASAYRKAGQREAADREMRQFREARNVEGGIDIAPFLSVLDRTGQVPPRQGLSCPIAVH